MFLTDISCGKVFWPSLCRFCKVFLDYYFLSRCDVDCLSLSFRKRAANVSVVLVAVLHFRYPHPVRSATAEDYEDAFLSFLASSICC
jgi:hypothetical protein